MDPMDFYGFLVAFYGFYRILLILWISMDFWRIFVDSMDLYAFLQNFYEFYPFDLWISMGFCFFKWIMDFFRLGLCGGLGWWFEGLGYCDFLVSWRSVFFSPPPFQKGVSGCWSYIVLVQKHPLAPPAPGKALECSTQI